MLIEVFDTSISAPSRFAPHANSLHTCCLYRNDARLGIFYADAVVCPKEPKNPATQLNGQFSLQETHRLPLPWFKKN